MIRMIFALYALSVFGAGHMLDEESSFSWEVGVNMHGYLKDSYTFPAPMPEDVSILSVGLIYDEGKCVVNMTNSRGEELTLTTQDVLYTRERAVTDLVYKSRDGVERKGSFLSFVPVSNVKKACVIFSFPSEKPFSWEPEINLGLRVTPSVVCTGGYRSIRLMRFEYAGTMGQGVCVGLDIKPEDFCKIGLSWGETAFVGCLEFDDASSKDVCL